MRTMAPYRALRAGWRLRGEAAYPIVWLRQRTPKGLATLDEDWFRQRWAGAQRVDFDWTSNRFPKRVKE